MLGVFFLCGYLLGNKNTMKHLLNDLSEEVKNSIREQHTGGMKVMTENFSKLTNTKSGDVKTLVEQDVTSLAPLTPMKPGTPGGNPSTPPSNPNPLKGLTGSGTWTVKDGKVQLMDSTGKVLVALGM
jgi:hypothetical protein